jgi:hypothetical protein
VKAPADLAAYRKHYNRGWRSSQGTADGALDRADSRNEPDAWYDGYLDYAAGRQKYHSQQCRAGGIECSEHRW